MAEITCRMATEADISRLCEAEKICFEHPWSDKTIEESIKGKKLIFVILEEDGVLASYACAWFLPPYEAQIGNIGTLPEYRNKGYAEKLLLSLVGIAERIDILDITLEVRVGNTPARNLYKKLGFVEEGIRPKYYEGKEDAVIMWLHRH